MGGISADDTGKKYAVGRKEHKLGFRGKIRGVNSWRKHSNLTVAQDQLYGMSAISLFLRTLLEC